LHYLRLQQIVQAHPQAFKMTRTLSEDYSKSSGTKSFNSVDLQYKCPFILMLSHHICCYLLILLPFEQLFVYLKKGKAHPLQVMQAQRGLGEFRLLDFLTSAPAAFTPRDIPGTHFHEGRCRPQGHGLVGRKYVTEKSSDTTGTPTSSAAP
jgi:hypothetical protein